jgi:predicted Zn-dependent peptidase
MILIQVDAAEIRSLRSNSGMASRLAYYQAITGDWREIVRKRARVSQVTPEDIQRVARTYFVKSNRIVAALVKPTAPSVSSSPQAPPAVTRPQGDEKS